ncbi:MAG: cell division protein ZapE, partial [Rickettsiales bacterium]|nr:cell division protein ZapE [Rickettsiales bacterium]
MEAGKSSLIQEYDTMVSSGHITEDAEQRRVLTLLDELTAQLCAAPDRSLLQKLRRTKSASLPGMYLYGSVGTGKSMVMDIFCHALPITQRRRIHFHAFMLEVHAHLDRLRHQNTKDPIETAACEIAKNLRVLCLDELQITDIADAMIVGRFFEALMEEGVTIITTSNRHPDDLYKDGLQRDRFLPFIALLKARLRVEQLDNGKDYRLQHLAQLNTTYFTPLGKNATAFLEKTFAELTNHATPEP